MPDGGCDPDGCRACGTSNGGRRGPGSCWPALEPRPTGGPDDLAPGFELSAAVLRHLQADPLLPAELLPPTWPGPALRSAYAVWDRSYRDVLRAWGRSASRAP